jgi:glycosyltransferase involved in cell wall biosynthesis
LANVKRTKLTTSKNQLNIVWNHRWEYDKGPELLLHLINEVVLRGLPIRFHIVGEQFRHIPKAFRDIRLKLKSHASRLGLELGAFGYVNSRLEYHTLLQSSDLVLSTALHDFQGLAIQEACLAGCSPITPRALVYPEYIPEDCMYRNSGSSKQQVQEIIELMINRLQLKQEGSALPQADLKNYSRQTLRNKYNELLNNLVVGRKSTQPALKQEI